MRKVAIKDIRKQDYFYSEAIKTLRTNIQLSGKSIKTILVTSCFPNEGKSDVALSLVQELSSIGKKVLLIDGDIRKSDFVIRLGIEQEVIGLSQFLSGQAEIKDLICSTNYPNLHIIFGGPVAPNPSGLLSEDLFRTFMKEIRNYYDYIVVDTPPVGSVIDAAVIARYCDGGIFVIEPGVVSYKLAQKCIRQIEKSGCRVIGAVMNKVDTKRDKYYSSYYKHYGGYYQKLATAEQTENIKESRLNVSWNSRKNNKFTNIILVIICIVLAVILGSLLLTNRKEVKQESERLENLSQKQETGIEDYEAVKEHASELKEEADEEDEDAAAVSGKEEKAEADRTSSDADETAEDAKPLGTDKSSDADKAQSTDKSDTKAGDSDKK